MTITEPPVAFDFLAVRGLIAVLEADGLLSYRDDGTPFPAGYAGTAAVYMTRPDQPERVASFTPYALGANSPDQAVDRLGVQVWMRYAGRNPRAVQNLAGAVRDTLHGLTYVDLSTGVRMSQCLRTSGSSLGEDTAGRWTWVENFALDLEHQTANRH